MQLHPLGRLLLHPIPILIALVIASRIISAQPSFQQRFHGLQVQEGLHSDSTVEMMGKRRRHNQKPMKRAEGTRRVPVISKKPTSMDSPFPPLKGESGDKILKSSKDALVVTTREYLRRDWCRTEPLVQRVKILGCLSKTLVNGFCYGQCNSFYIPRSPSERRNRLSTSSIPILHTPVFESCTFCRPKEITLTTLTVRCPQLKPAQLTLRRKVEKIKQCTCTNKVFNRTLNPSK